MRKLSGFTNPSKANEAVFDEAVDDVSAIARKLIDSLVTNAPPRNREVVAARARAPDSGAQGRVTIGVAGSLRPGCPPSTRCCERNADAFRASSSSALAPVSRLSMP